MELIVPPIKNVFYPPHKCRDLSKFIFNDNI